jgi:hypothetical protein
MSIKTVFLNSTARDLAKYRHAVTEVINGLDDYKCVRMEDFGARDWQADDFCRAKVAGCDLFVGVVGHLYGSCPEGSEHSYTEREYEAAVAAEMPRLMFIAPDDFPLPAHLRESDDKWHRQRAFRERVNNRERIRDTFTSPEDLARRVVQAIRNWGWEQARLERERRAATAHHVFLSYSREDTDFMRRLQADLRAEGIEVWTDETDLELGTPAWEAAIADAIERAGCLVVILSPDAKQSLWVGRELSYADEHGVRIFPVLARGDRLKAVPFRLVSTQRVDARRNYSEAVQRLVAAVQEHMGIEGLSQN